MSDTEHDSYAETRQWVGGPFDPKAANMDQLSRAVDALATKMEPTRQPLEKPGLISDPRFSPHGYGCFSLRWEEPAQWKGARHL